MRIIKIILSCVIGVFSIYSFAASLENTNFKHLSNEHRLSQKSVHTIFQDSTGFMWFGTQEGLNRFDGREIRIFRHSLNDTASISHDAIRDIEEDSFGNLWVATSGGLNQYLPASESFKRVTLKTADGENVFRLNTLFLDDKGILWVGTDGNGLFFLEPTKNNFAFKQYLNHKHLIKADVRTIYRDSRNRLWVGTDGNGISVIDSNRVHLFNTKGENSSHLSHDRIRHIYEDKSGKIWVATRGGGLNKYEEISKTFINYQHQATDPSSLTHNRVYQVYEDSRRVLWIATDEGISVYNPANESFTRIQHKPSQATGLSHNRILSIYEDRGGMMWFGTLSGLNQWNPLTANFIHYRHVSEDKSSLSNNMVYALAESSDGNIFVGTFGGGLNLINPKNGAASLATDMLKITSKSQRITSLMIDTENEIWVGTISSGIEKINLETGKQEYFVSDAKVNGTISDNGVTSLMQDRDGFIWVTVYNGGLHRYLPQTKKFVRYLRDPENERPIINDNLYHVMEDDEGYIWVSSDGGGISRFDKTTAKFAHYLHDKDNPTSLSGNNIASIYQDSKGRFWVGTLGNGLNRWEPENRRKQINKFKHYSIDTGMNSSTVYGVIEDSKGFIWISTSRGLSRLNPETDELEHFNLADEIHYNELNLGAILKASNGELYFGGTNGVSTFDPESIESNPHVPNVVLTKISSENKKLLFKQPLQSLTEVTFSHNDYLISFEFAALDFAQPNKNQYQYKLEGFDAEWIDGGHFNRATFTNLPAGSYLLKVKGSNNDGVWSKPAVNLRVNVLPAPWLSWWAFLLYGLSFCLFIFVLIRKQAKRLAEHELFQERVSANVEQKTELYQKNNQLLQQQVSLLSESANVDPQTGVPTQKFVCDLLHFNLDWIRCSGIKPSHFENKLVFLIVDLNLEQSASISLNDILVKFCRQLEIELPPNTALVRWDTHKFALLLNVEKRAVIRSVVDSIQSVYRSIVNPSEGLNPPLIAYSMLPYGGVSQAIPNAQDILMLTEHVLYSLKKQLVKQSLASSQSAYQYTTVGIISTLRLLDDYTFKQLLASNNLLEVKDVFEFSMEK